MLTMTIKFAAAPTAILLATILHAAAADPLFVLATAVGGPSYPIHAVAQNYTDEEGVLLQGFLSLPISSGETAQTKQLPAVIILHDRTGVDDYEKQRATIIARELGMVGFAADIFGLDIPEDDGTWAGDYAQFTASFTNNATLFALRIQAAVDHVRSLAEVDSSKVAIVGYCLGGIGVVHYLNVNSESTADGEDSEPLAAAISVHPALMGERDGPRGHDNAIPSLFLTGGSDFLTGPQAMAKLEEDMKNGTATDATAANTSWETVRYAKIYHAFSNWFSPNYDERADSRSWHSIVKFLSAQFDGGGQVDYYELVSPPPGPDEDVREVNYADVKDGDYPLKGYVSIPNKEDDQQQQLIPAVIIIPDGTGPDRYEQQRATQIASKEFGYVGFASDVYSHDRESTSEEELKDLYHSNTTRFVSRVRAAVDYLTTSMEGVVDPDQIAVVGFGFGGAGALYYAMSGEVPEGVKAIASFHGELHRMSLSSNDSDAQPGQQWSGRQLQWPSAPTTTMDVSNTTKSQILIQSGVDDDAMSDVIALEKTLIGMDANYEISRFSDTQQSFTDWNDDQGRYSPRASVRSMDQLASVLREVFGPTSGGDDDEEGPVFTKSPVAAPTTKSLAAAPTTKSPVAAPATTSSATYLAIYVGGSFIAMLTTGLSLLLL